MKKFLYNTIADRWIGPKTNMIYIYSDPHFGDAEINKVRFPHLTIEEADEYQIKQINAQVGRFNTLVLLGDIGDIKCVKRLKGYKKILIMGNHDEGNASNYERQQDSVEYVISNNPKSKVAQITLEKIEEFKNYGYQEHIVNNGFQTTYTLTYDNHLFDEVYEGPIMVNDRVILSHEPIEDVPSYLFNIHGHDHKDMRRDKKHYLNVCAEHIEYTPVPLLSLLKEGLISKVDSIHRETIDKATIRKNKTRLLYEDKK